MRAYFFSFVAALIFLSGCTVKEAVEKLRPSAFITHPELLHKPKSTPFDRAWISPEAETSQYDSLIVDAVRTDCVNSENWIYSASSFITSRDDYLSRLNELADYIQHRTSDRFAFYSNRDRDLTVVQGAPVEPVLSAIPPSSNDSEKKEPPNMDAVGPTSRALQIQISICDANFGDPLIYSGLLAVPVPAVANLSTAVKSPSVTLEVRLLDHESGEVLGEILDRRFPQVKVVDVNRMGVASALHDLSDSFVNDLVDSFHRKNDEKVARRWWFSLVPW